MLARSEDTKLKPIAPYVIGQVVGYVEPAMQMTDRCSVSGSWYVVNFEPQQGALAKSELASRGFVPYLPMKFGPERRGRSQVKSSERPMLGCYMFVKCERQDWSLVKSARGVRRFLGLGGYPIEVRDHEIEILRLCEAESYETEMVRIGLEEATKRAKERGRSGIVWHFTTGDRVRIKTGPFAGFYAQLESAVDSHDRLKALVSFLGSQQRADFSAFDIEAL